MLSHSCQRRGNEYNSVTLGKNETQGGETKLHIQKLNLLHMSCAFKTTYTIVKVAGKCSQPMKLQHFEPKNNKYICTHRN